MIYLLDVNVLIALIDPAHSHHDLAHQWFDRVENREWATCAITENGAIRILSQPSYGNALATASVAAEHLAIACDRSGHQFWPDDISLLTADVIDRSKLTTARQVTDTYLLGLAVVKGGKFATMDRRLSLAAVRGGAEAVEIVD